MGVYSSKLTRSKDSTTTTALSSAAAVSFILNAKGKLWLSSVLCWKGGKESRCVQPDDGVRLKPWKKNML